jgi:hypothetical protein
MRLIQLLAVLNMLAAAGFLIALSALSDGGSGPDPLQLASTSKTVPNSAPFALDIVSQSASRWRHRASVYRYFCYGLVAVAAVDAVALTAFTQWRPPAR